MEKERTILELFGGIGAPRKAFNNLNIKVNSDYIEIDKKVVEVYNLLYKENNSAKDVKEFKSDGKKYDYLIAGFPCQPFSQAGKRLGFNDPRGKLYKDTLNVIKETLPNNIILENVKGITREENKWIIREIVYFLYDLDYNVVIKIINSNELGFLQKRERLFIIASKKEIELNRFENFIETNNEKKEKKVYEINDFINSVYYDIKKIDTRKNFWIIPRKKDGKLISGSYNRVWDVNEKIGTITASNPPLIGIVNDNKLYYRKLNTQEVFEYMGFSGNDYKLIKDKIAKNRIYHVSGNSMVVGVIEKIIKYLEGMV